MGAKAGTREAADTPQPASAVCDPSDLDFHLGFYSEQNNPMSGCQCISAQAHTSTTTSQFQVHMGHSHTYNNNHAKRPTSYPDAGERSHDPQHKPPRVHFHCALVVDPLTPIQAK
jgi:hypothetical protein